MIGYWFWLLLVWSPGGDPNPHVLHMRYPTQEQCESDGRDLNAKHRTMFKCEDFYARGVLG